MSEYAEQTPEIDYRKTLVVAVIGATTGLAAGPMAVVVRALLAAGIAVFVQTAFARRQ